MESSRRSFLRGIASVAGVAGAQTAYAQHEGHQAAVQTRPGAARPLPPGSLGPGVVPVVTPDVPDMPWRLESGVKVFDIKVEHVRTEFIPGRIVDAWGFNGSIPGPTIQVNEGDRVRLVVENRLAEGFSMHWHGLEIPVEMDGMPGISQDMIPPGGTFVYEFTLRQNGTFFYHSHMAMQEMMGLIGFFIVHPAAAHAPRVDRDYAVLLQEWAILPNNTIPNTLAMEFNWLTFNGKAGPATTPMLVQAGRARSHPAGQPRDGSPSDPPARPPVLCHRAPRAAASGRRPSSRATPCWSAWRRRATSSSSPTTRATGIFHCHLPHHMMNQMASMVGPLMMSHSNMARPGSMTGGLGIIEGRATGESAGTAFGRDVNIGAAERSVPNMPLASTAGGQAVSVPLPGGADAPNRGMFPGYPQDMFMEMDDLVAKPETFGMRRGWSAGTMGMMTVVRVLQPEMFDRIEQLKADQAGAGRR